MSLTEYLTGIKSELALSKLVLRIHMKTERLVPPTLYVHIETELMDGSTLSIVEYVRTNETIVRDKYKYHWQRDHDSVRWDNVPHHREVDSFPHHIHLNDVVVPGKEMTLSEVLSEIGTHLKVT